MAVVTSSGFLFDRRGESVVLQNCPAALVAAAELEYLREVDPRGDGRIRGVATKSEAGRAMQVIAVDLPAGGRTVTFDVGPALFGRLRNLHEALGLVIYGMAGMTALGAIGFLVARFFG